MGDLGAYFYQHVFLAYHRYRQVRDDGEMGDNRDRREAIDAAIALYHLREHIPQSCRKSRAQLAALCPDYDLLGDIVNAAKHGTLTHGAPQVAQADSIREVLVCTRFVDEEGEYAHQEKTVEVELVDGSTRDIYEVLTNVVNMWFAELHRIGAIDHKPPIQLAKQGCVSRQDASAVALQLTQGILWQQKFRLQEYNYQSKEVEPVDLSDAERITFALRKPPTFQVEMGDDSGSRIAKQVKLTREQARQLEQIDDPRQRNEYVMGIAAKQGVIGKMLAEYRDNKSEG